MLRFGCLLVCLYYLNVVNSETIFIVDPIPTEDERRFMQQYGYLSAEDDGGAVYTAASLGEAVRRVQRFAGLPPTGLMDARTRRLIKSRRCGAKDIESFEESSKRLKRYLLQEGWKKRSITYRVLNGSRTLAKSRVEALMADALAVWAPHSGLAFSPTAARADIQVSFASRDHGDGTPFDGAGRVVAHAFPPPHGAMHFDDDETWGAGADDSDDVTDFLAVAVHETGHALGLSHSSVQASVMYPYYQVPARPLHEDDIQGLRALYSKLPTEQSEVETNVASSYAPPFTRAGGVRGGGGHPRPVLHQLRHVAGHPGQDIRFRRGVGVGAGGAQAGGGGLPAALARAVSRPAAPGDAGARHLREAGRTHRAVPQAQFLGVLRGLPPPAPRAADGLPTAAGRGRADLGLRVQLQQPHVPAGGGPVLAAGRPHGPRGPRALGRRSHRRRLPARHGRLARRALPRRRRARVGGRHVLLPRASVLAVRQRAGARARLLPAAHGAHLVPLRAHAGDGLLPRQRRAVDSTQGSFLLPSCSSLISRGSVTNFVLCHGDLP